MEREARPQVSFDAGAPAYLNAALIQRYLAMAYVRSRASRPQSGEAYWSTTP
jgi:hypothetical protein